MILLPEMSAGIQGCSSGLLSFVCEQGGKFSVSLVFHGKYTFHNIDLLLFGEC